jgi:NitT/TauT family transport system substrate-binding protein
MISRRTLLSGLTVTGAASALGLSPLRADAEPPPETTRVRIGKVIAACTAPQFVADELLRSEGFLEVQYNECETIPGILKALATGTSDVGMVTVLPTVIQLDGGDPIVVLAGVHIGCYELFGTDRVRSIRDLKGKTVGVWELGDGEYVYISVMAAYVGLDPRRDIKWVTHPPGEAIPLLANGELDAYMVFPPYPQELRARKIGHAVVRTAVDRPWSQYFCCMAVGNREFVRKNPVATKRALRAILKGADICAAEPERAARMVIDKGYISREGRTPSYEYTVQTLKELPYGRWREYDSADTVRFAALRLHEGGFIRSGPQKILSQGTDWRFLNELKRELKG